MSFQKVDGFWFLDVSGETSRSRWLSEIAKLTNRSEKALAYTLYENPESRPYAIVKNDALLGFQAFIAKPIDFKGERVAAFRSEFTIAKPELRSTGLFPEFYRWVVEDIAKDYPEAYFWGQTGHRAWERFGFRIKRKYAFYQLWRKTPSADFRAPKISQKAVFRGVNAAVSRLNPARLFFREGQASLAGLPDFATYKKAKRQAIRAVLELWFDEKGYRHRFQDNPFERYLSVRSGDSLLLYREDNDAARIVDIAACNIADYAALIAKLSSEYEAVVMHGNLIAHWRLPFFYVNQAMGFVPYLFGGAYVENNEHAEKIRWQDNPLFDSWNFGIGR